MDTTSVTADDSNYIINLPGPAAVTSVEFGATYSVYKRTGRYKLAQHRPIAKVIKVYDGKIQVYVFPIGQIHPYFGNNAYHPSECEAPTSNWLNARPAVLNCAIDPRTAYSNTPSDKLSSEYFYVHRGSAIFTTCDKNITSGKLLKVFAHIGKKKLDHANVRFVGIALDTVIGNVNGLTTLSISNSGSMDILADPKDFKNVKIETTLEVKLEPGVILYNTPPNWRCARIIPAREADKRIIGTYQRSASNFNSPNVKINLTTTFPFG
jgi:hypothetical protein